MEVTSPEDEPLQDSLTFPVEDASRAGEVRRAAVALAAGQSFSDVDQGRAAIVATEAATNLSKHAQGGEIILRSLSDLEGGGIELLILDRGPGIANLGQCLQDGYSTAGTAGRGLGGIRRQSDEFDIATVPGVGTLIVARIHARDAAAASRSAAVTLGAVCLPVASETVCGDAWAARVIGGTTAVLVADGLGHGLLAAAAAAAAVRVFREVARIDPPDLFDRLHAALRPTRGAAAALAEIDSARGTVRFTGVGNIAGAILGPDRRQGVISANGTLGHALRKVQSYEYPWPADSRLLLYSDGLTSQWDLGRYPGIMGRHPALIAGVLYRDYRRPRDDVTVLAVGGPKGLDSAP